MFASQWYGAAALFLFPWLLSAAHVMLVSFPVRGVVQAVVGTWYAQGVWTFWLAPFALASAYYLVPKIAGRPLPSYELAPAGFWCLLFIGAWTGGRHLIGGPVPAWIGTVGVVTSVVMLFHYATLVLNFRDTFSRQVVNSADGLELRFIVFGLGAYLLGGLLDAVSAMRGAAALLQFTWFERAQQQLALVGAASMIFFGAIYYALPRLAGRPLFSPGLRRGHFALAAVGVVLLVGGLALAGLEQGSALNDAKLGFAEITSRARSNLFAATVGEGFLLAGAFLFAVNFFKTAACPSYAAEAAARAGKAEA
jgi:cytochrome c oxidase cbb3-type subunit 1